MAFPQQQLCIVVFSTLHRIFQVVKAGQWTLHLVNNETGHELLPNASLVKVWCLIINLSLMTMAVTFWNDYYYIK